MTGRGVMQIVWPSFLTATAASGIFFTLFDPQQLEIFGIVIPPDRIMAYTTGFLAFWVMAAFSSAMTYLLARSANGIQASPQDQQQPHHAIVHTTQRRQ